ncbi:MAG: DNA-methyltransferase [Promethearchaeota archaeon]
MDRKRNYIPHLAEFYFKPKFNWSKEECLNYYMNAKIDDKYRDKIIYTDCIEGMDKLPDNMFDLIIADPPFGINFSGIESIYNRKKTNIEPNYMEVTEDYREFSINWIKRLKRIMKDTASAYIVSGYTNLRYILEAIDESGLILKNHIIWKYNFGVFTKKKFVTSHYHILFLVKNNQKYFFHRIQHYNEDVWIINREYKPNQMKNGTKLPKALIQKMIDFSSKPGDLIFDPFMGNGTTAVVAKANYRHYFGFEINEKMRPIIEEELAKTELGQDYIPYWSRLKTPEELAKIDKDYKKAYEIYLKEIRAKIDVESP